MYNFVNNMNRVKRSINIPNNLVRGSRPEKPTIAKTVSLFSQPYLDTYNKCYKNIVVINLMPRGPLADLVKFVKFPPLSEFKQAGSCSHFKQCGYALMSLGGYNIGCGKFGDDLMVVDEVPDLISYLASNGYSVDTSITKMFNTSEIRFDTNTGNKLICFVTYNG
jgi:hypothetical protein